MSSAALPTTRRFVTELLNSLHVSPPLADAADAESNPLSNVSDTTKKQLLSLQVLFPNEFVPALDLLDRRLVTRFRVCDQSLAPHRASNQKKNVNTPSTENDPPIQQPSHASSNQQTSGNVPNLEIADEVMVDLPTLPHNNTIYYVRSAQQRSSRFSTSYDTLTTYEVRLLAWNCSCPAFAFAAFPAMHPEPAAETYEVPLLDKDQGLEVNTERHNAEGHWMFGGVSFGAGMPPVCKHLLACVLAEKCDGLFGAFVEEREISVQEAAGWAAGWGD